jgi:hypothetical protein
MKRLQLAWAFLVASCVPTVVYSQDYSLEACWQLEGQECSMALDDVLTLNTVCLAPELQQSIDKVLIGG